MFSVVMLGWGCILRLREQVPALRCPQTCSDVLGPQCSGIWASAAGPMTVKCSFTVRLPASMFLSQGCPAGNPVEHSGLHGGQELALDEAIFQDQTTTEERRD